MLYVNKLNPVNLKTGPFPNFATDNMPIILAVLTKIKGKSQINETIFSNRFMAAPELNRMGAKIIIKKNKAIIIGQKKLNSADCISSDLRTTFSIILGAIAAHGSSTISRVYHGLRGYYNLERKLSKLGIKIVSSIWLLPFAFVNTASMRGMLSVAKLGNGPVLIFTCFNLLLENNFIELAVNSVLQPILFNIPISELRYFGLILFIFILPFVIAPTHK